jgi:hypothetical protein
MANEMEELLSALRGMKDERNKVSNSKETWEKIGNKDWQGAGFISEEEMLAFIDANPYGNMA